jgi:hypothetical protein
MKNSLHLHPAFEIQSDVLLTMEMVAKKEFEK